MKDCDSLKREIAVNTLKRLVQELDPLLHERGRLAIISVLAPVPSLSFTELRNMLEMTDGNLSVHLQKLEDRGYIATDKQFVGRRPLTTCRITKAGQQAFTRYLNHLETLVRQNRSHQARA